MAKRINVMLADATVRTLDRLSRPGQRSRFIERAIRHYVTTASADALHERLKQAAIRDRDLDRHMADEWLAVDQEQWRRFDKQNKRRAPGPREAKSTSLRSTPPSGTKSGKRGRH